MRSRLCWGAVLVFFFPLGVSTAAPSTLSYELDEPGNLPHLAPPQIGLLEKLNRADRYHLRRLPEIVVPDRWDLNELEYSPMPQYSNWAAGEGGKVLIVDLPNQVFGGYEDGELVRWGPVSSGRREKPTPPGLSYLSWRSRARYSTVDPTWYMEWYFNFDPKHGLALHKYSLPGRPASHACIRLLERDAKWLFEWGEERRIGKDGRVINRGTTVLVVGRYDFDSPPPWRDPDRLGEPVYLAHDAAH